MEVKSQTFYLVDMMFFYRLTTKKQEINSECFFVNRGNAITLEQNIKQTQ